jgi:hypothetical protein
MPDEPDIKKENLADTDESPLGDTTEHAGEQDTEEGETYADPEAESVDKDEDEDEDEEERFPSTESATTASAGEGEGAESVSPPDSERMANREDV